MNLQENIQRILEIMLSEEKEPIRRLRLTFPKEGIETFATKVLSGLNVINGSFTSSDEAVQRIEEYKKKYPGVILDELVIGSHGVGSELFMSQKGEQPTALINILEAAKPIIDGNTKIFFTACYGADYLKRLTDASNQLGGVGVYGAGGFYNYITGQSQTESSDKEFYYCKATVDVNDELQNKKNAEYSKTSAPKPAKDEFNKYALDNGYCKRVSKAPINWV